MDWGKTKSILIAVFILLNVFLLVNISISKFSKESSRQAVSNTVTILENRGIQLKCDIPTASNPMGKIEMKDAADFSMSKAADKLLGGKVDLPKELKIGDRLVFGNSEFVIEDDKSFTYKNSSPDSRVDISRQKSTERFVRNILQDAGIKDAEFVLDSYEKNTDGSIKLEFIHRYQGLNIFSNTIKAIVTENGLKELSCSITKPGALSSQADAILPAYKVLLTNSNELIDLVITSIDIGYNMNITDNDKPVWRVRIKGQESPKYFDASSGMEIRGT